MNKEKQRIAIAEAVGRFSFEPERDYVVIKDQGRTVMRYYPRQPNEIADCLYLADVPDYLSDLNACHEMEKALTDRSRQLLYYFKILQIVSGLESDFSPMDYFRLARATPAQRCEAFLKTIGKWEEE